MRNRILLVDDDPNILNGYKRSLRKSFDVSTALGGREALEILTDNEAFPVVVSDMRMPEMDGIQFLEKVKEISKDTVRIMLTGNSDQETAMNAVNRGSIFRFLTKPCPNELMLETLETGIKQYELVTAERELLEKTLNGSVNLLTEILSLYLPEIFGQSIKKKSLIQDLATALNIPSFWELEVAAMLSPIGFVGIPAEIISKFQKSEDLSNDEKFILAEVPEVGAHLLSNIPRLEPVAQIILYQNKRYDGTGFPRNSVSGEEIPFGSRLLKILEDLIQIESNGAERGQAIQIMQNRKGWYDPKAFDIISQTLLDNETPPEAQTITTLTLKVDELQTGQILRSDAITIAGELLLSAGQRLTPLNIQRLRNYDKTIGIRQPVQVEVEMKTSIK